jgi:hypothetical protein
MKKNPEFEREVLRCIASGIDTQAKIIEELNCNYSTLCMLLRQMVTTSKLESRRVSMHNVYWIRADNSYHDPFRLAKLNKNVNTFMLPPRRSHSMDQQRESR